MCRNTIRLQSTDTIRNRDWLQHYQNVKLFYYIYYFQKSIFAFGGESEIEVFICKTKVVASPQKSGKLENKIKTNGTFVLHIKTSISDSPPNAKIDF